MSRNCLTVVVPTYRRRAELALCLNCLSPEFQTLSSDQYEVVVSDDGDDNLESYLAEYFPWVRYHAGPRRGPAANRNAGARAALGDWLIFIDDDCLPTNKCLVAYWNAVQTNQFKVLEGKTSASGPHERADMESPVNLTGGYLWSCNFGIQRALFLELNGFDECFPGAAMEDVDFHLRLKKLDVKRQFVPEAEVEHPWRVRKGISQLVVIAKSIRYFVDKHPDARVDFRPRSLLAISIRGVTSSAYQHLASGRFRGLIRELFLLAIAPFIVFHHLYFSKKIMGDRSQLNGQANNSTRSRL